MIKKILKNVFFGGAFIFFVAAPVAAVATPTFVSAEDKCETSLLNIPPWYRGLTTTDANGDCSIKSPDAVGGLSNFIWKIVLNGIQIALVITGWIALFFILYGGFLFITGGSNASQIEKARKSIFNAVIGLIISMGAIAIVNLVFGVLGENTDTNAYGIYKLSADEILINSVNLAYYIAGIVAVIVIIVAGIMYVTSAGDSGRIAKAKNMILYSVVGIIVLLAAFAITNFVLGRFR